MAITVRPDNDHNNTHHIRLYRGTNEVGLILCNSAGTPDPKQIGKRPYPSAAAVKMYQGEQEYSDAEPPFSPVAQKDWSGGRGSLFLDDDATKFLDSYRAYTMGGKVFLGGQETYASGYRKCVQALPGPMTWKSLYSTYKHFARAIYLTESFTAVSVEAWIKRVNYPEPLRIELRADNGSFQPGALLQQSIVMTDSIPEGEAVFQNFIFNPQTLDAGNFYYVVFNGNDDENLYTHWEIAFGTEHNNGARSSNGLSWTTISEGPYIRVLDDQKPFVARFFQYKGQLYYVSQPDDGSPAMVYMNGFRGVADDNTDNLNLLLDAENEANFDQWTPDWWVEIYDGAGVTETDNWRKVANKPLSGDGLIVSPNWAIPHVDRGANITQYNILGADSFQLIQSFTKPVRDVEVTGEFVWFAHGEDRDPSVSESAFDVIRMEQYTDGFDWFTVWKPEAGVQASFLKAIYDAQAGYLLYLARNNDNDDDVSITRMLAPLTWQQGLKVPRPYYPKFSQKFMQALQTAKQNIAADTFNRVNGALGNTDGGTTSSPHSGGAGKTWAVPVGSITIVSNQAKVASVTSSRALATLPAGTTDLVVSASLVRAGGDLGVIVRHKDDSNYVFVIHDGTNVKLKKRVATTESEVYSQAVAYVNGAHLRVESAGTQFRMYYNGVQIGGDHSITEADLQVGTACGLFSSAANNVFDNFYCYSNAYQVIQTGIKSCRIEIAPALGTGKIAVDEINLEDWRHFTKLELSITSSKAMAAGELQLLIDDSSLCDSPIKTVDFPSLAGWVTYEYNNKTRNANLEFDLTSIDGAEKVAAVGLNLTAQPTAPFTIDLKFHNLSTGEKIISVGDKGEKITGLERYDDPETLWIMKSGSIWKLDNLVAHQKPIRALESVRSTDNGRAHCVHDVYLFFSLGEGLERYYREQLDDIGPNQGEGMPEDRKGRIVMMTDFPTGVIAAYDGGNSNYSAVLMYNEKGWHELYRAPRKGLRIRSVHVQPIPGTDVRRLWFSMGSDVLWIPLPLTLNPKAPGDFKFTHEAIVETSRIAIKRQDISKYWHSLKLITEQLAADAQIVQAQYRTDTNTAWTDLATPFTTSPSQEIQLASDYSVTGKWIQFRLILQTNDPTKTPIVHSMVVEPMVNEPVKYSYTLRFRVGDQENDLLGQMQGQTSGDAILAQLESWIANPLPIYMDACRKRYHNKVVKPQPGSLRHLAREVLDEAGTSREVEIYEMTLIEV